MNLVGTNVTTFNGPAFASSLDSGLDVILEDPNEKVLYLIQTKFVSLAKRPPVNLGEVTDFFTKHELMLDRDYVRKHISPIVLDRITG